MGHEPTGAHAPFHAPFGRDTFFGIRITRDPEESYAATCRILVDHRARPDVALERCSEWIGGFGVESVALADGTELLYVNKGDTYDATLCYVSGRGFFVSSWGDVYEQADSDHEAESGNARCSYCGEWSERSEPCGSCGRDPQTGNPWPEPLRHVQLDTGHELRTWDTGKLSAGRTCVGYELRDAAGGVLFAGDDFRPSPLHADDSDDVLRALLGFLTLRPGDTDADYFADYSAAQLEFAESSNCEQLAFDYSEDGAGTFADIDDDEGRADA